MRAVGLVAVSRVRRHWVGLVLVGLLAGMVGGLATAAVAGERRSSSAAERLAEVTAAPDASIRVFDTRQLAQLEAALAEDPDVLAMWPNASSIGRTTVEKDWYYPISGPVPADDIQRPLLDEGRMPSPSSQDEVAVSVETARNNDLHVGSVVEIDLYQQQQMERIDEDTETQPAGSRVALQVVGILRDTADVSPAVSNRQMLASPAFYDRLMAGGACPTCDNAYRGVSVRTADGDAGVERLLDRLRQRHPDLQVDAIRLERAVEDARPSQRVARLGTWFLAAIVTLVGGFVLAQVVRRQIAARSVEDSTLRELGLTASERIAAEAVPSALSAAVALLAVPLVAVAVSPAFPIGRARSIEPSPGVDADVLTLSIGALLVGLAVVGLVAAVAALELRRRADRAPLRPSWLRAALPSLGPSAEMGLRLATDPERRRRTRTARTAMLGAAVGLVGLVASLVFLRSLDHLVQTPDDFGIDSDLSIEVPRSLLETRTEELAADPELDAVVVQWTSPLVTIDGDPVDVVSLDPTKGSSRVTVLEGRESSGPDEVVVGPTYARDRGLEVGDSVAMAGIGEEEVEMTVVGIGLDPQVLSSDHGRTAVLPTETLERLVPADLAARLGLQAPYPTIAVRFAPGVDPAAKAAELDERYPYGVMDESFPHPPGLLRVLDDVRTVPIAFIWFFGVLALVAIGNGVVSTGRRARHDMGVARSLGFTSAQVRSTLAVTAVSMAVVAVAVGLPLGLVVGAALWVRVADLVDVVPAVRLPWGWVLACIPAAIAVAVIAGLWPARWINRRNPATVLRVE